MSTRLEILLRWTTARENLVAKSSALAGGIAGDVNTALISIHDIAIADIKELLADQPTAPTAVPEATCAPGQPVVHIPPHYRSVTELAAAHPNLAEYIAQLERELADLYEGRSVVLPKTAKHARELILVAEACLKNHNL